MSEINCLLLCKERGNNGRYETKARPFANWEKARETMNKLYRQKTGLLYPPQIGRQFTVKRMEKTEDSVFVDCGDGYFKLEIIEVIPDDAEDRKSADSRTSMHEYAVTIEESFSQTFPIKACDIDHAMGIAMEQYEQGKLAVQPSAPETRCMMAQCDETGEESDWEEF